MPQCSPTRYAEYSSLPILPLSGLAKNGGIGKMAVKGGTYNLENPILDLKMSGGIRGRR